MGKTKPPARKWTAPELLKLLAEKHGRDVFVPECKDGPTWGGSHLRMDAWAMRRSWSKPCVYAYEIKVGRSDFTSDDKWHGGLACCNQFYFVCPPGLIKPEELPAEVGLYWASVSGSRLIKRKPAHFRSVEVPECLYRYILMSRVNIVGKQFGGGLGPREKYSNADYWRDWLKLKEENQHLGYQVSKRLRELYDLRVERVAHKQEEQAEEIAGLKRVKAWAERMGLNRWDMRSEEMLAGKFERLRRLLPEHLVREIEDMGESLQRLSKKLEEECRNAKSG